MSHKIQTEGSHKKIDHKFAFDALSYDAKPNYQPYVKLSFFFNKLPHVSYEQFHKHWETIHADLTVGTNAFWNSKVQRYVQFHAPPEAKEKVKGLGLELMDYDGCSEIWVKSFDDWEKFANDPNFGKKLVGDSDHFMQLPFRVMAGYENLIFGPPIPGIGGVAGVSLTDRNEDHS